MSSQAAENAFKSLPTTPAPSLAPVRAIGAFHFYFSFELRSDSTNLYLSFSVSGSEIRHREDDLPYAYVALAVQGAPWNSPDFHALQVATSLFGSWNKTLMHADALNAFLAKEAAKYAFVSLWRLLFCSTSFCELGM